MLPKSPKGVVTHSNQWSQLLRYALQLETFFVLFLVADTVAMRLYRRSDLRMKNGMWI